MKCYGTDGWKDAAYVDMGLFASVQSPVIVAWRGTADAFRTLSDQFRARVELT